jgi:hypothetical protein
LRVVHGVIKQVMVSHWLEALKGNFELLTQ